jgi:transcriptional regulator GlxA family with amidase domain
MMRVHAMLLDILSRLQSPKTQPFGMDPPASLWWNLETQLRRDLSEKIDLSEMAARSGRSVATLTRSCRSAVGLTPMKQLKQIRLSLARGLVRRSGLSFSAIAARIGYDRVHEFSRDYRKHFGITATEDRSRSRVSVAGG